MARYREKIIPLTPTLLLLALFFIVAFAPWSLGNRELSWREGYGIAQAQGIAAEPLLMVTVHGEAIPNVQPLFPLLTRMLIEAGCPEVLTTRILSLLFMLGTAVLVFLVAYRTRECVSSGACAGAMMLLNLLAIDKTPEGFNTWLLIILLLGGHLLWYYFAALKGNWTWAWLTGFAACTLGFCVSGISALVFFILPLIFMRRPLGIFRRLRNRGVFLGVGVLALTMLLWKIPYYFTGVTVAAVYPQLNVLDGTEYVYHLLTFPWDLGIRLMPWVLLAWAPYCVAFQTLDKTPMFSRFLRTLFLADFFLLWILPLDETRLWMILLPPLAIMTGLNYELLVRRYGNFYQRLGNAAAGILLPVSALILLLVYLLPGEQLNQIPHLESLYLLRSIPGTRIAGIAGGIVLMVLFAASGKSRQKPPVWCLWLLAALGPLLVYNCVLQPAQALKHPARDRAEALLMALKQENPPPGTVLYKYEINDLFAEGIYMQIPIRKINSLSLLPGKEQPTIYVLTGNFPNHPERIWNSLLPQPLTFRGHKLNLWRGQWQEKTEPQRKHSPLLQEVNRPAGLGVW